MKGFLRTVLTAGIVLALGAGVLPGRLADAAPLTPAALAAKAAPGILRVGACREGCADCNDCPTEIDIAPRRAARDDPIAREIHRFGPAPLEPCERNQVVTSGRRATLDADSCGIRCWYWRLRHGYCGPGCEYYRYRMYNWGKQNYHQPRYACGD